MANVLQHLMWNSPLHCTTTYDIKVNFSCSIELGKSLDLKRIYGEVLILDHFYDQV